MAPPRPMCPARDVALQALFTALANLNNISSIFSSQEYFSVPIVTLLRHLLQLTAPCFLFFFLSCSPEATILVSFLTNCYFSVFFTRLVLLSPKTWCCSESALGLFIFLKDHSLLVLCLTLTFTDTPTTPRSLLWFLLWVFRNDTELFITLKLYVLFCWVYFLLGLV